MSPQPTISPGKPTPGETVVPFSVANMQRMLETRMPSTTVWNIRQETLSTDQRVISWKVGEAQGSNQQEALDNWVEAEITAGRTPPLGIYRILPKGITKRINLMQIPSFGQDPKEYT